jgi:hypothetical protein
LVAAPTLASTSNERVEEDMRLLRVAAAMAAAGLLGLTAACDTGTDKAAPATPGTTAKAEGTKTDAAKTDGAKTGGAKAQGMKDGCDAVHKIFQALDAGDKATAEGLKTTGKAAFDGVMKAAGDQDPQLSANAEAMSDMLAFELPPEPIHQSTLAETYAVDCVRIYGAPPLEG